MPGRAFLDTNVLAYAVDDSDPVKRDRARALFADSGSTQLVLSTQVLSEFYVVATRKLATPLGEDAAAAAVDALAELPVVATDTTLVRDAIHLSRARKLSLWDALVVTAASAGDCDTLLTEDLQDGATIDGVVIRNPFAG